MVGNVPRVGLLHLRVQVIVVLGLEMADATRNVIH